MTEEPTQDEILAAMAQELASNQQAIRAAVDSIRRNGQDIDSLSFVAARLEALLITLLGEQTPKRLQFEVNASRLILQGLTEAKKEATRKSLLIPGRT